MRTKSSALLAEGTTVVAQASERFKGALGWTNAMVDRLFTHQVSEPQQVALKALDLPSEIDFTPPPVSGKHGVVAAPISMAMGLDNGFVKDGDRVVLLGVGSGINSIVLGIQW